MEKCQAGRFFNDSDIEDVQKIAGNYECMKNLNVTLYGSTSNSRSSFGKVYVQPCTQDYLDEKY
eukprot:CAMPEP_0170546334 /NCGR_PEP_ID=MMETSP0211-20121228/4705_1 /TAXON_ID=311385 /ORGANISM="Pseudokeronopsis sp., Strain OXSARD2" /LENGTH=63 /DNA_ID=CAMNT_0010850755 /DNA_START=354 /DNA_END=545 /DNA_ORIENTATION=+